MRLFKKKLDVYDEHEQLLVERVIEALRENPEDFSAKWWTGKSLDSSVQHKNGELLITVKGGEIIRPLEPKMSDEQKYIVKKLLEPIVKRDSYEIIKNFTL